MNARFITMSLVGLLMVAGCIPSLNPVYRNENLVFDPSLIGLWKQPDSPETWHFAKRDNKSYNLVFTDEKGQQGRFTACIAEIQGKRFLDIYPDEAQLDANGFYKFHLVPIHTIYLVRRTEPHLELGAIEYPWLDDFLADHPGAIEHAMFGGRALVTGSTEQVQGFVLRHLDAFTALLVFQRSPGDSQ